MKIEINTDKNTIQVTKDIADEIRKAQKRKDVTVLMALERVMFLEDLKMVTVSDKKREISKEESEINHLSVDDIKEIMKTKSQKEQDEFNKFYKEQEDKINREKGTTKKGKKRKVNTMIIKSWYKSRYFERKDKKEEK